MVTWFWLVGNYRTIVSMQYTATLIIYYCTATTKYLQSKSMQCNVLRYKFTDYGHVGASLFKLISSDKNTFWHMASKCDLQLVFACKKKKANILTVSIEANCSESSL